MSAQGRSEVQAVGRNAGIDLLRGISILLVVLHHVGLRIPLKKTALAAFLPQWFLDGLIYNGTEAVFIFFVISGFLIASHSLSRWGSLAQINPRAFYIRRATRILPCLLALLAVLSILHVAGTRDYVIARPGQSLGGALTSALGLHLNWYEGRTGYLPGGWDVLWSLSIEEAFYLGFPLLCLGLRRRRLLVPLLLFMACSLPATRAALQGRPIWQEKAYLPGMAGIATGVLGALLASVWRPRAGAAPRLLLLAGAAGTLAVLFAEGPLWRLLGNGTQLILTSSALAVVLAFHWQAREEAPWRLPGTAWLRTWGRLSYEIYLTHMFVVFLAIRGFRWETHPAGGGVLWYLPAVLGAWGLGWLVARGFTDPVDSRLRQRFL